MVATLLLCSLGFAVQAVIVAACHFHRSRIVLAKEAHPGQGRYWPTGHSREVAAGVLPMGCFCSSGGSAGECGTARNSDCTESLDSG